MQNGGKMRETIIKPLKCEGCLFFDRDRSNGNDEMLSCRFYSNHKPAPKTGGDKFPFCIVESVTVKECESARETIMKYQLRNGE
jgi:hypothetical protein